MSTNARPDKQAAAASMMAAGTLLTRLLGIARLALLAVLFGNGTRQADMLALSTTLPNLTYLLVAGALLAAVVGPQIARAIAADSDRGEAFVQRILTVGLLLLAGLTVGLTYAVPWLVRFAVAPGWREPELSAQYGSLVLLGYYCMPQIFFLGLHALAGQILQARGRYGPAIWAGLANNVISLLVLGMFWLVFSGTDPGTAFTPEQVRLLGAGATVGIGVQALLTVPFLITIGYRFRPRINLVGSGLGRAFRLGGWVLAAVLISQIAAWLINRIATGATVDSAGAGLASYQGAYAVWALPFSVVTVALGAATLPVAARAAAAGDRAGVLAATLRAMRTGITAVLPAALGFGVLGLPLARALFGWGRGAADADGVGWALIALSFGMVPFTVQYLCVRTCYAMERTRGMFFVQLVIVVVDVGLAVAAVRFVAEPDRVAAVLGLALSVAYLLGMVISFAMLQQLVPGLRATAVVGHCLRVLVAAAPGIAVAFWLNYGVELLTEVHLLRSLGIGLALLVGWLVFYGLAKLMRLVGAPMPAGSGGARGQGAASGGAPAGGPTGGTGGGRGPGSGPGSGPGGPASGTAGSGAGAGVAAGGYGSGGYGSGASGYGSGPGAAGPGAAGPGAAGPGGGGPGRGGPAGTRAAPGGNPPGGYRAGPGPGVSAAAGMAGMPAGPGGPPVPPPRPPSSRAPGSIVPISPATGGSTPLANQLAPNIGPAAIRADYLAPSFGMNQPTNPIGQNAEQPVTQAPPTAQPLAGVPAPEVAGVPDQPVGSVPRASVPTGSVLGNRYRLEELLGETPQTTTWRAFDRVLSRSVLVHLLSPADPGAYELLQVARQASAATDSRFLRVLDVVAGSAGVGSYIVCEYVLGQSLEAILTHGPLSGLEAGWVVREVADALAGAHTLRLYHERVNPDTVIITPTGNVKIVGLQIEKYLRPDANGGASARPLAPAAPAPETPEQRDVYDLGRLLYAALVARWPDGAAFGLPGAPVQGHRFMTARQVRAGVPPALDQVCNQILGEPTRPHAEPITSAIGVVNALTKVLGPADASGDLERRLRQPVPLVGAQPPGPAAAPQPVGPVQPPPGGTDLRQPGTPAASETKKGGRKGLLIVLIVVLAVLLVGGGVTVALYLRSRGAGPTGEPSPSASASTSAPPGSGTRLAVTGARDFDPQGDDSRENPGEVARAIDGDPKTRWRTVQYLGDPKLGGIKRGVGLVVDLGQAQSVGSVRVLLSGKGTNVEVRVPKSKPATITKPPLSSDSQWRVVGKQTKATGTAEVTLGKPTTTRFVLIYLTSLPKEGNGYRGGIFEIEVYS